MRISSIGHRKIVSFNYQDPKDHKFRWLDKEIQHFCRSHAGKIASFVDQVCLSNFLNRLRKNHEFCKSES